jgi:hypothetical protein
LGDLHKLFRDRCRGSILPDDDCGRDYLKELLKPISLGPCEATGGQILVRLITPIDRMRHEIHGWAPWITQDEAQDLIDEIERMPSWQRKPKASTIGIELNVTYAERQRLGLRTIAPCDITEAGMMAIRKQKKRQRDELRQQSRRKQSRTEYLASHTKSKEQPWIALGISRRSYYYRIKRERQIAQVRHHIKIVQTGEQPVQSGQDTAVAVDCVSPSRPTHAEKTDSCADAVADGYLSAKDAAWLVDAISPADLGAAA